MALSTRAAVTWLTALSVLLHPSISLAWQSADNLPESAETDIRLFVDPSLDDVAPDRVVEQFAALARPLTYAETLDYATARMLCDQFAEAAILYEQAVRLAPNEAEKVFAMVLQSQAILDSASTTDESARPAVYARAGETLNRAALRAPNSDQIAAMRVMAWTQAGDDLEVRTADHHLRRLGASLEGREVFLAAGIMAIVFAVAAASYGIVVMTADDLSPAQKRTRLLTVVGLAAAAAGAPAVLVGGTLLISRVVGG